MMMPDKLQYWTADEVAECLTFDDPDQTLAAKLWSFFEDVTNPNPTPAGGDGSNGTVEEPCGRLDTANDDKAGQWWNRLTESEQATIAAAPELADNELIDL